jgi:hypothetical protein
MEPRSPGPSLSLRAAPGEAPPATAGELLRKGRLCQPLMERLNHGRDQAAFEFLSRETSLDVLNECIRRIPDQQMTENLVEQLFMKAALLSSEAFTGIEEIRRELKNFSSGSEEEPVAARRRYDREVEKLGQHVFALSRRLHQLEQFMASCPLTGSGEQLRGRYGQRVRDLAGDVRFMRQELSRWVRRFVPLKGRSQSAQPESVDREFLEGRIDAVVDELGLRIREIHETLSASLFEQLVIFDPALTRQRLFRRDLENVLDIGQLLDVLANLFDRVKEFDEGRRADQLQRVKTLLRDFRPEQFLSFSGIRESDQALFLSSVDSLLRYEPASAGSAPSSNDDDPVNVFLLLTGDLVTSLRSQQRARDQKPVGRGGPHPPRAASEGSEPSEDRGEP